MNLVLLVAEGVALESSRSTCEAVYSERRNVARHLLESQIALQANLTRSLAVIVLKALYGIFTPVDCGIQIVHGWIFPAQGMTCNKDIEHLQLHCLIVVTTS